MYFTLKCWFDCYATYRLIINIYILVIIVQITSLLYTNYFDSLISLLSTVELTSPNYQVLDGPDQNSSINTISHSMDSTNSTGSNNTGSNNTGSSGITSSGAGSNEARSNPVLIIAETPDSGKNVNTPDGYTDQQWQDSLLSLNCKNVPIDNDCPVGADFSNNNYQNTSTQDLRSDYDKLSNYREVAVRNSDFLQDQLDRHGVEQEGLYRAEAAWRKEVQDADKLLEDIKDELSRR